MDVFADLAENRTIDITTTGARSGEPRRIEIWAWPLAGADGVLYLTGSPGQRDWYANLKAEPAFTVHLKRGVPADLAARARLIEDPSERLDIFTRLIGGSGYDLDAWIAGSPLVEVEFTSLQP